MKLIHRKLQDVLVKLLLSEQPQGVILTGIVGSGKTTLIEESIKTLENTFQIFRFSGDDIKFREAVASDSDFIANYIAQRTTKRACVFVDEVQKTEAVFDAIKVAFDRLKITFIVSGSNPDFLNTKAKHHLQRRAILFFLTPFTLPEVLRHLNLVQAEETSLFQSILLNWESLENIKTSLVLTPEIEKICREYLIYGGLPLSFLAPTHEQKLLEIKKTIERGFEQISNENDSTSDLIRIELAKLQSQEFSYQGIFQRTRLRRRERINEVIDFLINHGYLVRKHCFLFDEQRRSYLSVLSYIDPGIVTYLTGIIKPDLVEQGHLIEGVVHSQLDNLCKNLPTKSELGYYKPYVFDKHNRIKYLQGEVDFIFKTGKRIIPIEVKSALNHKAFDTNTLKKLLKEIPSIPFGIVLYGGLPIINKEERIIYFPWWLV